jgi:hypothetical protein
MQTRKISELMIELECILKDYGDLDVMMATETGDDETTLSIISEVNYEHLDTGNGILRYVELS